MSVKIDIRARGRWTLVGIEILVISVLLAVYMAKKFAWDTFTWIIGAFVIAVAVLILFMKVRFFRYAFSIIFSLWWGIMMYFFAKSATDSTVARWVAAAIVTAISLGLHKDYFEFERN